jgi:hypothetical protein
VLFKKHFKHDSQNIAKNNGFIKERNVPENQGSNQQNRKNSGTNHPS